jgi:uncharacterized protein
MWKPWVVEGLEHLRLALGSGGAAADSVIIGIEDGAPFRIRYTVRCDAGWRVRELRVSSLAGDDKGFEMFADGEGRWSTADGRPAPSLEGCFDVDISATPFTNTLPIRRLGLEAGESANLEVLYLAVPEMRVVPARQRYVCLKRDDRGGLYRYESLDGEAAGFTADLPVDADGLVLDYPGLFKRARLG